MNKRTNTIKTIAGEAGRTVHGVRSLCRTVDGAGLTSLRRLAALAMLLLSFAVSAEAETTYYYCQQCPKEETLLFSLSSNGDIEIYRDAKAISYMFECTLSIFTIYGRCLRGHRFSYEIGPVPHDWGDATHVDPTCTENGGDRHTCNRCGATETYNEVAALGHDYGEDHICTRCSDDYGTVSYLAADGVTVAECSDYKFIVGEGDVELGMVNRTKWYAVYGNVSLTSLKFKDKVSNIILLDGATLSITATGQTYALNGNYGALNIYGQAGGTGRLVINADDNAIFAKTDANIYGGDISATSRNAHGISAYGNVGIAGGTVSGTSTLNGNGIFSIMGTLSVTGGNVTATGGNGKYGMSGDEGITLGWTTATSVTSNSYGGSVTLAKPFLGSDGNIYASGAVADASVLNDVTLISADFLYDTADNDVSGFAATTNVALYGRTIYRDGNWNTLCLPFPLPTLTGTPLEGFTVMELDGTASHLDGDGTLYLNFKTSNGIEAGKPYIVKKVQVSESVMSPGLSYTGGTYYETGLSPANNLLDGITNSSWIGEIGNYCEFKTGTPVYVTDYTLTASPSRVSVEYGYPKEWKLYAKKSEGDAWILIDRRFTTSFSSGSYSVQQPGLYQYFQFVVLKGGRYGDMQYNNDTFTFAELSLQGREPITDNHLANPVFSGVNINTAVTSPVESTDGEVSFVGSYSPVRISDGGDRTMLYLDRGNQLCLPDGAMTIGSCRAVFRVGTARPVSAYVLSFADGSKETGSFPFEAGDANRDGRVTVTDAVLVLDYVRTHSAPAGFSVAEADADGNESVTEADAVKILGTVIGAQFIRTVKMSTLEDDFVAQDGDVLTGSLAGSHKISIAAGATVTLDGVTINGVTDESCSWAGLTCLGDATIILKGSNTVKGFFEEYPGIQAGPKNTKLIIQGAGSLTATGSGWAAGIGSACDGDCGSIEISGGEVTAYGGGSAAGIGSGSDANCDGIIISGGKVTATGGGGAAGIGSGQEGRCANIIISGGKVTAYGGGSGAGIGSGNSEARCGDIEISAGDVTATGGRWAAAIGSGYNESNCGTITIKAGVTSVTATKGSEAPNSIGAGADSSCGSVNIEDGATVTEN